MSVLRLPVLISVIILTNSFGVAAQQKPVVDLPMRLLGTRPAVEVMVNGKGPFLFLIDTGAEGMARVDTSLVQRLGLQPVGKVEAGDARSSRMVDEFQLDTITFGAVEFRVVKALSRNYNTSTAPNAQRFDGILAFNLFSEYLLTLNYPAARVILNRGELPKPDKATVLSYESPYGTAIIELHIGKMKVKADVDSGDNLGLTMPTSLVEKLSPATQPKVIRRGESVSGKFEVKEVQLKDTLRLGRYKFIKPTITYTDAFDNINLGSGMLREFSITFDQRNKRARFERKVATIRPPLPQ